MSGNANVSEQTLKIQTGEEGRLDVFLASRFSDWSRTSLQRLINGRFVLVDGHPVSPNHKLLRGQTLTIRWPKPSPVLHPKADSPLPFPVIYEDKVLLVVNKPPGLVVHPSAGHRDGDTLVEIVAPRISAGPWPEEMRPGLVHRLDRDTSGVIVLAKTPDVHSRLSKQFAGREVKKTYMALVQDHVKNKFGTLESHLGRHPGLRQRFAVASSQGRWAMTKFRLVESYGEKASLLELTPLTGRTHQIRIHLASFKHPILGDHVYGTPTKEFSFVKRQMLHAAKLQIIHPRTQKEMLFEAALPEDFQQSIKLIRLSL